jgi:DNA-binding HxlR family transcriptional regulator
VEYELTPMGRQVAQQVDGLVSWIEGNLARVQKARAA